MSGHNADTDTQRLTELAELSPLEYDRTRKSAAKELKVGVSILDSEVRRVRRERGVDASRNGKGRVFRLKEITPSEEPIAGALLLQGLARQIKKYLSVRKYALDAIVLCRPTS